MKTFVVIPAFNEEKMIGTVVKSVIAEGYTNVIVVDDGSFDNTYSEAKKAGAITLKHQINRGKGAATQTGMDAAGLLDCDIVITMDADGQHVAGDIKKIEEQIKKDKADVVIGSRLKKSEGMPFLKILANHARNFFTFLFYGIYVTDSQSGFRGYNKLANDKISTTMDRYEFESEVLNQAKNFDLRIVEVPITVMYTEYSKTKYNNINFPKQKLSNGINMLFNMILKSLSS